MDEQRKRKLQTEVDNFCEGLISNARVSSAFSRIQTLAETLGQAPYVVSITSGDPRAELEEVVELRKKLRSVRGKLTRALKAKEASKPSRKVKAPAKPSTHKESTKEAVKKAKPK